ncbi:MAG: SIS domain-containing protein [Desulfobacterales bacterium]|nr:SIS domain-containing protein [Desulfobacterales bacterium]
MRDFKEIAEEHIRVLQDSIELYRQNLKQAAQLCINALAGKARILVCGNGGSAADAQHFAAELVGRYETERKGLAAIALSTDTSAITAIGNDYGFDEVFSRQIRALACKEDVLVAISTSGNSSNIVQAAKEAREAGMKIIAFTGQNGGRLGEMADVLFAAASKRTARIQEIHEIGLHALAEAIETETCR